MAISFESVGSHLEITFSGTISSDELIEGAHRTAAIEAEANFALPRIVDITGTTAIDLDFRAMETFASLRAKSSFQGILKSALVTASPVQYGFGRMYQLLNRNPKLVIQVFGNRQEALAWLAQPIDKTNKEKPSPSPW